MSADHGLWGIDLGGTKIEGAIVDASRPDQPARRTRAPTESDRGYAHIIAQVRNVVERLEAESGRQRPPVIGIGTPGVIEPATGTLKNSNTVCLNGQPLAADLSAALGVEVRLANDANCFALAEATLGAARGRPIVLGLIIGTGVGSGIVIDGHALPGRHGIAGEWGHNPMRGEHAPCYCGRAGCVETVISGPALERHYEARTGQRLTLPEIVRSADGGDGHATATLGRLSAKFGEAIAAVINILDPDAIVIGGGVGNISLLYDPATRDAIRQHLFNPDLQTEILRPTLGDSAGVFGAALLARGWVGDPKKEAVILSVARDLGTSLVGGGVASGRRNAERSVAGAAARDRRRPQKTATATARAFHREERRGRQGLPLGTPHPPASI